MNYFVPGAILSLIFFAIILLVEPIGEKFLKRFSADFQEKIGISVLRILFGLISLVVPFSFLWMIASYVHPATSLSGTVATVVFSSELRSALLGAVFGLLFLIWILQVYSQTSHKTIGSEDGLSRMVIVEGYLLLALFVIGCVDLFGPLLQRISGLKVAGAELTLSEAKSSGSKSLPQLATLL